MRNILFIMFFYYIFMQVVSIPGDEPDWAGDWSPEGETGVSYPYWEGWQVQHVVLCESMGASDLFSPLTAWESFQFQSTSLVSVCGFLHKRWCGSVKHAAHVI